MPGALFYATPPAAINVNAAQTVLMLTAAANRPLWISHILLTTNLTDPAAAPGVVQLFDMSSAGTFSDSITPVLEQGPASGQVSQTTAQYTPTAEPTTGNLRGHWDVDRGFEVFYPLGQEKIVLPGGRFAIKCQFGALTAVRPQIWWFE